MNKENTIKFYKKTNFKVTFEIFRLKEMLLRIVFILLSNNFLFSHHFLLNPGS